MDTRRFTNRIITTAEDLALVPPPVNRTYYTTEELSAFIGGGLPEILGINRKAVMVVDDNFRAKALPFNVIATWIYAPIAVRRGNLSTYPIRGDVAIIVRALIQ
jgi:hypothetical protein